ncbi:MAG: cupin domain-containing protein [Gemmatimonadota bacterium]|nr:cupin domain-containing protein [Gemmatimonadota bacterium]MDH3423662.1 cupin domain-containing protein [Gemmatimonadota bacterium]
MYSNRTVATPPYAAVFAVVCVGVFPSATAAQSQTEAPFVINYQDAQWGPPGNTPRFPEGVQTAQLGVDPDNGGPIYLARFPTGSNFDLHWHTHAEYVVVVQGRVTIVLGEETHALRPGSYVVIPERMPHSWDVPAGEDAVILVRRRGPADFHFVDP